VVSRVTPAYVIFNFYLAGKMDFVIILKTWTAGGRMDIQGQYEWQELYAAALLETDWSGENPTR
jgi:hypothetical protein